MNMFRCMCRSLAAFAFVLGLGISHLSAQQYTFYFKVLVSEIIVYQSANTSFKMGKAKQNQVYKISKKLGDWIGLEIKTAQGIKTGWVQAQKGTFKILRKLITVDQAPRRSNQLPNPERNFDRPSSNAAQKGQKPQFTPPSEALTALRIYGGPVYNIRNYIGSDATSSSSGSNSGASSSSNASIQWRGGLSLEFPLSEKLYLGVPIFFTTGAGFQTVSGGLHGLFYAWSNGKLGMYFKLGTVYEYIYGRNSSNQFVSQHAANVDLGLGLDIMIRDKISIGLEPLSAQLMVFNSSSQAPKLPVRGQGLVSFKFNF